MSQRIHPLSLAVRLLLGAALTAPALAANAQSAESEPEAARPGEEAELPVITVSALAMGEEDGRIVTPYSLIDAEALTDRAASTLGEALGGQPGVHVDSFGGGASRPVIRGQSAPRVKVLSDSASVLDASDISPDHAVGADPLLSRRIEVLRGPATLLYGSGAVGGVVNVLDNKIASALPEGGLDGSVMLRGGGAAGERAAAGEVSVQAGSNWVLHAEGSWRDADDYRVPDWDEPRVDGSFAESRNAAVGLSWVGDNGFVGIAYSRRDDDYGLPGHNHEFESCHPHDDHLHCEEHEDEHGDDEHEDEHDEHEHEHEAPPVIDLESRRLDLRGEFTDPFSGFDRIRFRLSDTDYRHTEIDMGEHEDEHDDEEAGEHDDEHEHAEGHDTTFRNDGYEARIELQHSPRGRWSGVFGVQHSDTRFSVEGAEAFMPTVDTRSTGLFVVEHIEAGDALHFELGARHEWLDHSVVDDPRARPDFDDTATSFSGAAVWEFAPDTLLSLSAARSERLPHAQELYARGIHLATNTYECGLLPSALTCGGAENDRAIGTETSHNIEVGLRRTQGALTFGVSAFANDVDDYIYARTLDQFEEFRLIKYTQADARFRGIEAEVSYAFSEDFSVTVFGDRVNARLADGGGNLPRIAPSRLGLKFKGDWGRLDGELEFQHVARQDDIADFESETPGYDLLNLSLGYRLDQEGRARLFLRGSNLLDEQIWNHTSFLAGVVPMPGRGWSAGLRYEF
ncbi:MAG: TonB-dependent receptor [Lysobacteraceae bacterium]